MRIANNGNIKNQAVRTDSAVSGKKQNDFYNKYLEKKQTSDVKQRLKNLLERIDIQAQRLSSSLTVSDLKEYKRLVSEFLNIAVSNSHKFSKERFLDTKGRFRFFCLVKKVNEEIDSLTNEVMKKEKNRIDILSKLYDIRGILVDIIA